MSWVRKEGGTEGGTEVPRVWGKTTIGRLKYLLAWNSACARSRSLHPPPSRRLGLQNTTYEKRCNKQTLRSRSYFFPKNQPKFPDPPPPVSPSPCGRNKETRVTTTMTATSGWTCSTIHPSIHPSIWSLLKDPPSHPASRRGFFSSILASSFYHPSRTEFLIHFQILFFFSSILEDWLFSNTVSSIPGYLVLLIHLGGLTFLIHSSLSIFSSIPDYLPLLLIHPRLNIFSSIFRGAQLSSSILAETFFSSLLEDHPLSSILA